MALSNEPALPPGIPQHWHAELRPHIHVKHTLLSPVRLTTLSEAVHYVDSELGAVGESDAVISIVEALSRAAETGDTADIEVATAQLMSLLKFRNWLE